MLCLLGFLPAVYVIFGLVFKIMKILPGLTYCLSSQLHFNYHFFPAEKVLSGQFGFISLPLLQLFAFSGLTFSHHLEWLMGLMIYLPNCPAFGAAIFLAIAIQPLSWDSLYLFSGYCSFICPIY